MPIPDFQTLMLPLLIEVSDGNEKTSSEYLVALANAFQLTAAERQELLPSGKQPRFSNRVAWAVAHLSKAGLVERTGRGRI